MAKSPNLATPEQLLIGAEAVLKNAHRLIKDANILLKSGSAPTAHSLAILALEEASKAYSWAETAGRSRGDTQVEVPSSALHSEKLERARSVWVLAEDHFDGTGKMTFDEIFAKAKDLAKNDNVAKQRGFYADLEDGAVKGPSEISEEEAAEMIEMVESLIGLAFIGALYRNFKKS